MRRLAGALILAVLGGCVAGGGPAGRPAAPGSRVGGTLTVAMGPVGSVDPLDAYEPNGQLVARTMCDTLIAIDPATGRLAPGLARSWVVSDSGTQISFRLRADARFSDGTKVEASDVVFSLSRAASPAFAGRSSELLRGIVGWDELQGRVEADDPRARKKLLGVSALTGDTVRVLLREADASAVNLFTHPVTTPVSAEAVRATEGQDTVDPVCSGPYRLTEPWRPGAPRISLERVDGYTGSSPVADRGGAGYADRIEITVGGEVAGAAIDLTGAEPAAPLAEVGGPAPGAELIGLPQGQTSPFTDLRVRQALSLAIDRERVASAASGREPASGFVPPSAPATHDVSCGRWAPRRGNPDQARGALAGAPVDLRAAPIRLVFNDDGPNRATVEEVAAQWRDVLGLDVRVEPLAFADLLAQAAGGSGLPGPFRISWASPVPGAAAHIDGLFHSGSGDQANLARWNDPELDRILDREVDRAGDEADRLLALERAADRLCATLPALPLTWARARVGVDSARVATAGDRWIDPTTGSVDLRRVWLR